MEEFNRAIAMELPRMFVVGHDAIDQMVESLRSMGLKGPALIVADSNTKNILGERVAGLLIENDISTEMEIIDNASKEVVDNVTGVVKERKTKFLLGVGGGRPIDIAKAASSNTKRPFISMPTAAAHDGIVSSTASIRIDGINQSISCKPPLAVIADTGIIAKAPHNLLASGCGDIVANYSAVRDWQLAKMLRNEFFSSYAATLSEMTAAMLVENANAIKPNLEESAWLVMKALVSSGVAMSIAGSSRPASGSEHKFSHALDRITGGVSPHGANCGMGTIMMMYLHRGDWKMIREALNAMGAPTNARELGVKDEQVVEALTKAHNIRPERYTILGDTGMTLEAAEQLARTTKVIE